MGKDGARSRDNPMKTCIIGIITLAVLGAPAPSEKPWKTRGWKKNEDGSYAYKTPRLPGESEDDYQKRLADDFAFQERENAFYRAVVDGASEEENEMVEQIRDHRWWNQKGRIEEDKHDPWCVECKIETMLFEEECTFYLSEGVGGAFHAWQESEFEKMKEDSGLPLDKFLKKLAPDHGKILRVDFPKSTSDERRDRDKHKEFRTEYVKVLLRALDRATKAKD